MSKLRWFHSVDPCDGYYWHCYLPNGWSASISDWSQSCAPKQPTRYAIAACSKSRIIQAKELFSNFEDAKREALNLALQQEPTEA